MLHPVHLSVRLSRACANVQFKVNGTSAQCYVVQGWRATYRVGMGHRDVHTNGDDGYRMESAENPWVWAQMLREFCGNGSQSCGNPAGMDDKSYVKS